MSIIDKLEVHRDKWGKMLNNLGCPQHLIDDTIHDMYLRIYDQGNEEKILYGDDINIYYVYLVLRSLSSNHHKIASKTVLSGTMKDDRVEEFFEWWDLFVAEDELYRVIMEETENFGVYGCLLSHVYFPTDYSLRYLSDETGISKTSIYNSIRKYRSHLKDKFKDHYEEFAKEFRGYVPDSKGT